MTDPTTPTEAPDVATPAPEEPDDTAGVGTGARMDPHGEEPQDDPLPEGIGDEEDE